MNGKIIMVVEDNPDDIPFISRAFKKNKILKEMDQFMEAVKLGFSCLLAPLSKKGI